MTMSQQDGRDVLAALHRHVPQLASEGVARARIAETLGADDPTLAFFDPDGRARRAFLDALVASMKKPDGDA